MIRRGRKRPTSARSGPSLLTITAVDDSSSSRIVQPASWQARRKRTEAARAPATLAKEPSHPAAPSSASVRQNHPKRSEEDWGSSHRYLGKQKDSTPPPPTTQGNTSMPKGTRA